MSDNSTGNSASNTWNESNFSHASNQLLKEIVQYSDGVDLIQLLEIMHKIHPEYGSEGARVGSQVASSTGTFYQKFISFLKEKEKALSLSKFTSGQWTAEVLSIFHIPRDPTFINGRLFLIASLLFRFGEVFEQLNKDSEWSERCIGIIEKLDDELVGNAKISFDSLLTTKGRELMEALDKTLNEPDPETLDESIIDTNNLSDGPAQEDSLSRMALAKYLSKRIRHIYNRDIDKGKFGSFFMHIDGAWGSGKSTLLGFLERQLKTSAPKEHKINNTKRSEEKWIIVTFNAWENQRLDPPWWFLMKAVYREAMQSLRAGSDSTSEKTAFTDKARARKLFWNEFAWGLTTGKNYMVAAGITLLLFIGSFFLNIFSENELNSSPLVKMVTFIGFLWSMAKLFSSNLASGSAKAAKTFVEENSKDPMQVLSAHFKKQIATIHYPVAIFIDDLDRCNKDYGIMLLEGLQTIFKKAGVVYVIAADRRWLSTMYEQQYEMYAPVIARPAKPFGLVFLDKIFQLIVELPDISAVQKKIYWDNLLNVANDSDSEVTATQLSAIKEQVETAGSNASKMDIAAQNVTSPKIQQIAREEILGALSIGEEENILEHKLQKFVDLIEPNPRAMKRLINDVSTARAIAFLYNQEVNQDQLILWTILKLQHPLLAEFFWINTQKISEVTGYLDIAKSLTGTPAYDQLIASQEVKKLFNYSLQDKIISLNAEFIKKLKFQA